MSHEHRHHNHEPDSGLAALGWALYNAYLAGQTGQSYGMQQFRIRLLNEKDGQVIGGGMGIARAFVHVIDSIPCYVGWLWPLWDAKKQTFTDKVFTHVVIDEIDPENWGFAGLLTPEYRKRQTPV